MFTLLQWLTLLTQQGFKKKKKTKNQFYRCKTDPLFLWHSCDF